MLLDLSPREKGEKVECLRRGRQADSLAWQENSTELQAKNGAGMQRMGKWKWDTHHADVRRDINKTASTCGNERKLEKKQRDIKFNQLKQQSGQCVRCH